MMQLSDHPDIRSADRTGYPIRSSLRNSRKESGLTCEWCNFKIPVDEEYYDIRGLILCFDCGTDCIRRAEEE